MKFTRLTRIAALGAVCVAVGALTGLPWADATSTKAHVAQVDTGKPLVKCIKFDADDPTACGILRQGVRGPQGPRGKTGPKGAIGRRGATGPQGLQGPVGPVGAVGPQGLQGIQGPRGFQGVQGAPGSTVVVAGTPQTMTGAQALAASPITQGEGAEITPSVATCSVGPATDPSDSAASNGRPEAYGGGVQITKTGTEATGDVVTVEQHFLGTYNSPTSVTVIPAGTTAGTASTIGANAYEGQAVVTELADGDSVTVQAFVICGP